MKKLLIIGFVWPEPNSSAAGQRMMQLISFFKNHDYQITFASACNKTDNATDLTAMAIDSVPIQLNHSSFDTFILDLQPQIVLFDRFMTEEQFGWRVSQQCPQALKILDTEDLHFLRRARQDAFKRASESIEQHLINDTTKREIASIYRCDLSLIISKAEMRVLMNTFKLDPSLLLYVPFLLDPIPQDVKMALPEFASRKHFISIGNFLHEPNYDALLYLKQSLWKAIRKQLPTAELHNYGAYSSQKIDQLHNEKEGFLIKGFAENAREVMQGAKVLLAPLRFGAGLKGKLFDAMQSGTPFVSTTIGAEGIIETDDDTMVVCDDPEKFVAFAVALYKDHTLWSAQQEFGFELLESDFSKDDYIIKLTERLQRLTADLEAHRRQNFVGQMLQHHTMQSTKYMSRWIEIKTSQNEV
ncbi:glycosyltransferase [Psychroserpens sp. BH13MA-6]